MTAYTKTFLTILTTSFLALVAVLVFAHFSHTAWAQASTDFNPEINYQAKLTDSSGSAVENGDYDITFRLFNTLSGGGPGDALWTETRTVETRSGLFSVMLGSSTPLTSVDFNQLLYLEVQVATDTPMTPRKALGTVPAAFVAQQAIDTELFGGIATSSFLRGDITNAASAFLSFLGGAEVTNLDVTGDLDVAGTTTITTLVIDGETFTSITGSGLERSGTSLIANIGASNLNTSNVATNGFVLLADDGETGGLRWAATSTLGFGAGGSSDLAGLSDVSLSGLASGQLLSYTGSGWANVATGTLGLGDGTFLGLSDTISTFTANRLLYTTSSGVVDSENLSFDGTQLTVAGMGYFTERVRVGQSPATAGQATISDVTREQIVSNAGTSASFGTQPTPGNLLIVTAAHRSDAETATISGSGWTKVVEEYFLTSIFDRRGLVVFWKIAGLNEPTEVSVTWDGAINAPVTNLQEFSVDAGEFVFDMAVSDNSGTSEVSSLFSGETDTAQTENNLIVGVVSHRGDVPAASWTNGLNNNHRFSAGGSEISTVQTAWGGDATTTPKSTTASWSGDYHTNIGLVVFSLIPDGSSNSSLVLDNPTASRALDVRKDSLSTFAVNYDGSFFALAGGSVAGGLSVGQGLNAYSSAQIQENLGIGTLVPDGARLNVRGSGTGSGRLVRFADGDNAALMTIRENGLVGIGTSSPSSRLAVDGDLRLTGAFRDSLNSAGGVGYVLRSTGTSTEWVETSTLGFGTSDVSALADLTDVSFTGSPSTGQLFSFNGSNWTNVATSSLGIALSDTTGTLAVSRGGTGATEFTAGRLLFGAGTDPLNTSADLFWNDSNGWLGIGTDSPNSRLTVDGTINVLGSVARIQSNGQAWLTASTTLGNFAVGSTANINNGDSNVFFGAFTGAAVSTSSIRNTFIGNGAGTGIIGSNNVAIGMAAAFGLGGTYEASGVVAVGHDAGLFLSDGADNNTLIGRASGPNITSGSGNIALGHRAGIALTTGSRNIMIGYDIEAPSSTADGQLNIGNLLFGTGIDGTGTTTSSGNIGIGTSTPTSRLTIDRRDVLSGVAGITQYLTVTSNTASQVAYGNFSTIVNNPTEANILVGELIRIEDISALGNVVRGLEVQADRGTNTGGENTGLSGIGRTFGVRGVTRGTAGAFAEPAGGYFETQGSTQGNAIRAFSSTIQSATLVSLFQASSTFSGTGLEISLGNTTGSFSGRFLDLVNAGTSRFFVTATGTTIIDGDVGIGTTTPSAQLTTTGTVRFAGLGSSNAELRTDSAGNVTASSDERLKDILELYQSGVAAVRSIEPIIYNWSSDSGFVNDAPVIGFSAQNIQSAIPGAVGTDSRGNLTLSTQPILAALVNATKEQQALIDALLGIGTTTPTSTIGILAENQPDSLWSKMVGFFEGFVDGVLSIAGLKTERVETEELCLDDVCVTADDLRQLLDGQAAGPAPATSGGGGSSTQGQTSGGSSSTDSSEGSTGSGTDPTDAGDHSATSSEDEDDTTDSTTPVDGADSDGTPETDTANDTGSEPEATGGDGGGEVGTGTAAGGEGNDTTEDESEVQPDPEPEPAPDPESEPDPEQDPEPASDPTPESDGEGNE